MRSTNRRSASYQTANELSRVRITLREGASLGMVVVFVEPRFAHPQRTTRPRPPRRSGDQTSTPTWHPHPEILTEPLRLMHGPSRIRTRLPCTRETHFSALSKPDEVIVREE